MTCPTKTRALAFSMIQQMDNIGVWQRDLSVYNRLQIYAAAMIFSTMAQAPLAL
jgi:hypothetical protein